MEQPRDSSGQILDPDKEQGASASTLGERRSDTVLAKRWPEGREESSRAA